MAMSDFNEPINSSPLPPSLEPMEPQKNNRNRNIILAVVGVSLLLCCCCVVVLGLAWTYGDQILNSLGIVY